MKTVENLVVFRVNGESVTDFLNHKTLEEKLSALRDASSFEAIDYLSIEDAGRHQIKYIKAQKNGLIKIRDRQFSCVNEKNNLNCASGFVLYPFKPLREKLSKTFQQQMENAWFYADFKILIITNLHVVEVG